MTNGRTQRVGAFALAVLGVLLGLFPLWHLSTADEPPVNVLISVAVPVVLVGVVEYGSWWVKESDLSATGVRRLLGWTALSMTVAGLSAGLFIVYQTRHGAVLYDTFFVGTNALTGGAALGLVVGRYDVLSRQRERQLNATSEVLETVRKVNQAVTRASDRDELEARVCEELADSSPYRFAWVGEVDGGDEVVPRVSSGVEDGYLDDIRVPMGDEAAGPTARAVQTRTVQVVQNVLDDPDYEQWREQALERGYQSSVALPLAYDETLYGVLNIYADRPYAFEGRERRILEELGETIGHGIAAIESRERYRTLLETAPDPVFVTDLETARIVEVNAKAASLLGRSRKDLLGSHFSDLHPAECAADYEADFERLRADGRIFEPGFEVTDTEVVLEAADGTTVPVELNARTVELEGRTVMQGNFRDVTERKAREQRLTELEEAIEQAGDGIMITDRDGVIKYANPALEAMTGYSEAEMVGDTPSRWKSGTHSQEFYADLWGTILSGEEWRGELLNERKDGTRYYIEETITPLFDDEGEVRGFVGISTDITHRKEMEESLREREERFRCMFEQHSAPMLLVDPETAAIVDVNRAAVDYYGYDEATLTETTIADINALSQDEVRARMQQVSNRERKSFVFEHELASGETRSVEVHSTPIPMDEGTRLFSIVHDVTDRRRYEQALERQTEQLEVLNGLLRHDIRNDMAVIIGMADLLREHVDDEGLSDLETLQVKADHVVELTHTARNLTESMGTDPDSDGLETVALDRTLRRALDEVQSSYPDVEVTVDGDLPSVEVVANDMLDSVFGNVLNNAVQHNDSDDPQVEVTPRRVDDRVEVRIADNGPGIPDRMKERVFRHGQRGTQSSGTGLGLYLVGTLVEQFGGDVWVEDVDPTGAAFVVSLRTADAGDRDARSR